MDKIFWRKIHRWLGLLLVGYVIFYCLTGLLLNHRQDFNYFQAKQTSVVPIKVENQEMMQGVIDAYKQQINRSDNPKVIRIKDGGVIEFLYGSHGRTTYVIEPQAGTMTRIDKEDQQPWYWLNRLHKAYKTSLAWQLLADCIALLAMFLTCTGLFIFRYNRQDFLLLVGGLLLFLLGLWVA